MRFQQELQQMLQVQSLPSLSHGALAYLEACLQASLLDLIIRLKYILRRYSSTPGVSASSLPYGSLVLLLHLHNQPRFYRLASFLGLEEARKKAKESASGASELDMLNENNDDPANDGGEHFDDAWLGGSGGSGTASTGTGSAAASSSTVDLSPATLPQAFLATSVLSTYGDDFVGMAASSTSTADDGPEAILRRKLPPGFLEHIRRVQATDAITVNMSPSEYIQYSESRAQAGFTHHKIRSKRFREFVTPLLTLHDIPITDELLDILGFLAHEIVFDHIEQGKEAARKRINAQRRLDLRARKAALRDLPHNKGTKEKGSTSRTGKKSAAKGNTNAKKNTKLGPKEKKAKEEEDKKKELERLEQLKIEEQNRHPDGPFSAPAGSSMTHGMPVPIHCPADIDGPLEIPDDPAVEHAKTDNTTTHASITSAYDVLLGDFEEAFHSTQRDGWDRIAPARRRRRFVDLFR